MPTDATPDVVHMDRHPKALYTTPLSEISCSVLTCPEWERRAHLGDDVEGQGLEHSSLVGLKQRRAAGDADGATTNKTSIRPASLAWVALLAPGRRPERRSAIARWSIRGWRPGRTGKANKRVGRDGAGDWMKMETEAEMELEPGRPIIVEQAWSSETDTELPGRG
ncbi:hypothetical protein CMUS01_07454 [Colletotrichum musicola]|uniref:Uncharacterized protein n=1 Tax=Colletotrichum musicola TaxID=2175873 RepID=A0A8H6KHM6_9PEZI|nr:hypothetical protein CMUS01_07454 [Colletotrichum musicola]